MLPERSSGQLVLSNLASDLRVSAPTAKAWGDVLAALFVGFFVRPWFRKVTKSLRKEPKWYLRDKEKRELVVNAPFVATDPLVRKDPIVLPARTLVAQLPRGGDGRRSRRRCRSRSARFNGKGSVLPDAFD